LLLVKKPYLSAERKKVMIVKAIEWNRRKGREKIFTSRAVSPEVTVLNIRTFIQIMKL
jgi:hypothetical protein